MYILRDIHVFPQSSKSRCNLPITDNFHHKYCWLVTELKQHIYLHICPRETVSKEGKVNLRSSFHRKFGCLLFLCLALANCSGQNSSTDSVLVSESVSQSVQSLTRFRPFATPCTAAHQPSLSITNSRRLLKLMSIESVMPPNHLIHCHPLLLLPSIFPSIRVFSNESALHIRWPKY